MKPCIVWDSILSLEKSSKGDISQIVNMTTALAEQKVNVSLVALNAGRMHIDGAKIKQVPNLWYIRQRTRTLGRIFPRVYGYESRGNAHHVAKFVVSVLDPYEQYDLYHVRSPYIAMELKRLQPSKPLVYTSIPRYLHSKSHKDKILDQKVLDVADKIIALTEGWKRYNIEEYDLKGREITVVPVCVPNISDIPEIENLPEYIKGRKIIGYFGRLQEKYGIDTLIETIPEVKRTIGNVGVIIAGGSFYNYDQELKKLAYKLDVYGDIFFTGEIPRALVPSYMKKCNVLISLRYDEVSDRFHYGFDLSIPIKCVEYITCGKPVVATRDGGMEQLLGKDYPYLVDHNNKSQIVHSLIKLLTDDEEAARIGIENKRISMSYTYESVVNKLIGVYRKACE
jgi:glycosyltransferase involved in cell wall biosynthesis